MQPKVLIVSPTDLEPQLGQTVLWRDEIQRVYSPSVDTAFEAAASLGPSLVVLDALDTAACLGFAHALRAHPGTRRASLLVLSRSPSLADEEDFRRAGANLVLAGHVDPLLWDLRLEELLNVPQRREARIPVHFEVWSRFEPEAEGFEGFALNLSVRGMLLETGEVLDVGTKLDLRFTLPGQAEDLRVVGQVVREADAPERPRLGVEFLILRGEARERIADFIATESGR